MVRAAMEGVAFTLRGVQESLKANGVDPHKIRIGSGGASSKIWMEIVASVLEKPLEMTLSPQPGLLGSAMLGYTALGRYADLPAATAAMVHGDHVVEPQPGKAAYFDAAYEFFQSLTAEMQNAYNRHAKLAASD
jgi:gluconokinase